MVFVVSLIALIIRLRQQRPLRGWSILAGVSLVLSVLFSGVAGALYGSSDNPGKDKEAFVSQESTQEATQESTIQEQNAAKTVAEANTSPAPSRKRNEPTTPDFLKKEYTNPQTPEETVLASIERERGVPLDKHQDIRVAVDTDQNGCRNIQLNYQTVGATSIESEMRGFYKAIYGDRQYGSGVCEVTITAYGTLTDRYGQRSLEEVYQITLGRYHFQNTNHPELRFRALLTNGSREVRFERVAPT